MTINSSSIHYSRAGDKFHYRWAVKRCLKLLNFDTDLTKITIEGSEEQSFKGEDVIDLAEYSESKLGLKSVEHFQLKHSTVRIDKPFILSELEDTITGFAKRFTELTIEGGFNSISFTVITNRLISLGFKENIEKILSGEKVNAIFLQTIKKYTSLNGKNLKAFCSCLYLCDSEGNYDVQKYDIHRELAKLSVSKNVSDRERLLVSTVWDKIDPGVSNVITVNDMLAAFNVLDIQDFFPAPPQFESLNGFYIPRRNQVQIVKSIRTTSTHTIITAIGGIGKSIFSSNLSTVFNEPNIVVAYDCFGGGNYRKASAKRHSVEKVITQVINTLAKECLCDQLIPTRNEPDEHWIRLFLRRIEDVCLELSSTDPSALLVIAFDAVDNAEMAANQFGESCFANQLLKETVPENCRLIFTCRPERLDLLDPPSSIIPIELPPFSDNEAFINLQQYYPDTGSAQAREFNRLTAGNPRVQSNALALETETLDELLLSFGSYKVSVEDLIERQLEESINRIKDQFPRNYRQNIDDICTGLANLPPFIPLGVLAKVAEVSQESVKSFIADLGRPLWLIDEAVQFRDEPTEKWFQDRFSANPKQISNFIELIKDQATSDAYVAEALPILLLQAERFDELVDLALSGDYLPAVSEYDDNQLRIYRLHYAFKAALKAQRLPEAIKLALRAGEEIASNERLIDILTNNTDLASRYLSKRRIEEISHRRVLKGKWTGSELIYSASLLSLIPNLEGEASSYLRSANYWLQQYFENRKKLIEEDVRIHHDEKLEDLDILEMTSAYYYLHGWEKCVDFILSWQPPETIFRLGSLFIERLVDFGEFEKIDLMANYGKSNPSFILAINSELMLVGKTAPRQCLTRCLNQIINPKTRLNTPDISSYSDRSKGFRDACLSFFEACTIQSLPIKNIRRGINHYYHFPMLYEIAGDHPYEESIESLLRYLTIQAVIKNDYTMNFEGYAHKAWKDSNKEKYKHTRKIKKGIERINKLLPIYTLRAKVLTGSNIVNTTVEETKKIFSQITSDSYGEYDPISLVATKAKFQIILFSNHDIKALIDIFEEKYKDESFKALFLDRFYFIRASYRNKNLLDISDTLEDTWEAKLNKIDYEETPESRSDSYLKLCRAVLNLDGDNAKAYFDEAMSKASNFGQEAVLRWEALSAIARRSAEDNNYSLELAHRYMRCAEMIGDSVSKEKHWDRNDVITTCFQLSPISAFAIAYRWKDRNIGWSERQIHPLAYSAMDSKLVSSSVAWSLSAFSWEYGLFDFFKKCLEAEEINRQKIFDQFIRDLKNQGNIDRNWLEIRNLAKKYRLQFEEPKNIQQLVENEDSKEVVTSSNKRSRQETPSVSEAWNLTYGQFDILTSAGLENAFRLYNSRRNPQEHSVFWPGCIEKVTSKRLISFLNIVIESELLDFYELRSIFSLIPLKWKDKTFVINNWDKLIFKLASRFPSPFTGIYERDYMLDSFILNKGTNEVIQQGVINGLSGSVNIESADALFLFVHSNAKKLLIEEAKELINFGLSRLELFIDDDYADGVWDSTNKLYQDASHGLVYYVYANLGSPFIEERWKAIHAVIRLYKLGCQTQINQLIDCLESGLPSIYIPTQFKFYDLHARLYLLVALTRCVFLNPEMLIAKIDLFSTIALDSQLGVLLQYYAKQICLEIRKKPNSLKTETFIRIEKQCVSQFSKVNESRHSYKTESPWHQNGSLNNLPDISFPFDFYQYWFEPLGQVFGISSSQVSDLAKDTLLNEWGMDFESNWVPDSRKDLWNSLSRYDYSLLSDGRHGSYPRVDSYSFYVAYHLMFVVAARLLKAMPVVQNEYDEICSWEYWLQGHSIISDNALLLSELRDPIPIERREWIDEDDSDEWRWQISVEDFIDLLVINKDSQTWLNVEGSWNEVMNDRNERISYKSILVPKALSQSLLHTTINYENHNHECYLYDFCEPEYGEIPEHTFLGKCWLKELETYRRSNDREDQDPFAGDIRAEPFILSQTVTNNVKIKYSEDQKQWFFNDDKVCFKNKFWSEDKLRNSDDYIRTGSQALASLELLICICKQMNVEIAIQVNIDRSYTNSYRKRDIDDEFRYIPKYSKTFILSADGKIRDTRVSYQLR